MLPLLALPVLGGVLLAFVIASFEDDDPLAPESAALDEAEIEPQTDTAVQDTVEPADEETVTDTAPTDTADQSPNIDVEGLLTADDFTGFSQNNVSPDISAILGNGTPRVR